MRVIIGLGSNTPDGADKIASAIAELNGIGTILATTRNLVTQDIRGGAVNYLNALAMLDIELPAATLKSILKEIEAKLGRRHDTAEVAIDLDLLAYGNDLAPELMGRAYNCLLVSELLQQCTPSDK